MNNWGNEKPPYGTELDTAWLTKFGCVHYYKLDGTGWIEPNLAHPPDTEVLNLFGFLASPTFTKGRRFDHVTFEGNLNFAYVDPPLRLPMDNEPRSMSIWINIHNSYSNYYPICGWGKLSYLERSMLFINPSRQIHFSSYGYDFWTVEALNLNEWYFIVFTYDETGIGKIYINAKEPTTYNFAGNVLHTAPGLNGLTLAQDSDDSYYPPNMSARTFCVYNQALSMTEIQQQYHEPYYMFPKRQLITPSQKTSIGAIQSGRVI